MGVKKVRADLTDKKFGRLTVVEFASVNKHGKSMWKCRCECGNEIVVVGSHLTSGHTTSCRNHASYTTHGKRHTRLYRIWLLMKNRCSNAADPNYGNYGGRGIKVCEEWQKFIHFYEWAMTSGYVDNLTIDRIDNNGNYEPSNCRWATQKEQSNNKRTNVFITHNSQTHTLKEWSEITGINYSTLHSRYKAGKPPEEVLRTRKAV